MASDIGAYKLADEVFRAELAVRKGDMDKCEQLLKNIDNEMFNLETVISETDWDGNKPENT